MRIAIILITTRPFHMPHNQKLFEYSYFRYPQNIANFASFELSKYSEIPTWIHSYHTDMLKTLEHENEYLKKDTDPKQKTPFLLKDGRLVSREAGYVANRLRGFDNINFVNLGVAGFNDSLDLITPLLEKGKLAKYVMASQSNMVNHQWIDTAQRYASRYNTQLKTNCLEANFDTQAYLSPLSTILPRDAHTTNLLFIGASTFGNHINPTRVLKNIHDSMNSGDFLLISQAIYKPSSEGFWVGSFINFLTLENHFGVEKEFAHNLSPDCPMEVVWEDEDYFRGIKFRVEIQEPVSFGQVKLREKQKVDVFRGTRFSEAQLKTMALQLDFRIVQIIYGDTMDTALLFLQKN